MSGWLPTLSKAFGVEGEVSGKSLLLSPPTSSTACCASMQSPRFAVTHGRQCQSRLRFERVRSGPERRETAAGSPSSRLSRLTVFLGLEILLTFAEDADETLAELSRSQESQIASVHFMVL